ncbi:MAG: ketopantoate reductase family protein [Paracoccaceae bacterium]|nr:MAG: ketopantoate reductase family protein [Paracoccaceae bacterium]
MAGMRILVLGAGGTGGYFGGRLAEGGADVTFLVREARAAALRSNGLRIASQFGDVAMPVQVATSADPGGGYDLALVSCKAYDLDDAIGTLRPAIGPDTAILPILNGIAHLDRLVQVFGEAAVMGGTAKIQVTLSPDGVVQHLNDWRFLTFGERDGRMSDRVAGLAAECARAKGMVAEAVPDIAQRMWEKLVHVATSAGMTCLMRANVGEIVRTEQGRDLLLNLLAANAEVAARSGHPPSEAFMATYRATFSDPASQYSTSMLRDIERGARTEGMHIVGFMAERARAAGIAAPILDFATAHLQAYEQRRLAGRL